MKKGRGNGRDRSLSDLIVCILLVLSFCIIPLDAVNAAGLKDAAAKANLNFGDATDRPSSYTSILQNDYNMLVCENAMKFQPTEPTQGNFTFSGGDQVLTFAQTNKMQMRGHTLVWHAQTSAWIQNMSRDQMLAGMKEHINGVLTHFKGKILEWDVVNEAVSAGTNSFWRQKIGPDFIDSAFVYAHAADPQAFLYYNDYGGEGTGGKGDQIYNMVKDMKTRGIPIHGVGFQCHFSNSVDKAGISANMKRLGDLGLRVSCTEIDIANTSTNGTPWKQLMQACLENYNVTSFVTWGISDAASWRGSSCGCLVWDAQNQPKKLVYDSLMSALNSADPTIAEKRKTFSGLTAIALQQGAWKSLEPATPRFLLDNGSLTYLLPKTQEVRVQLIDALGKVAGEINLGTQAAGRHSVRLTSQQAPAGVLFARIKIKDQYTVVRIAKLL